MMMTDCFSPACSGSKALPSLTFCGMMTSQSVSNSMGVGWIYPLFEGYTQHMEEVISIFYRWIYPLFEGYTQLFLFNTIYLQSWIYPLFEGYTQQKIVLINLYNCWIYPLFEGYTQQLFHYIVLN